MTYFHPSFMSWAASHKGALYPCIMSMSQHLERCTGTQVLDMDTHQKFSRFVMKHVLPRQYYV